MKKFISIFIFIHSFAMADTDLVDTAVIVNKSLEKINQVGSVKSPCNAAIEETSPIVLDPEFSANGVGENCYQYIESDGKMGPWGQSVLDTIKRLPKNEIQDSFLAESFTDMDLVCPNYKNFGDEVKLKFWVWTFAAISWQESSCDPKVTAQGTNSKAVGLLQLEDSRRLRGSRGDHCDVKDIRNPSNNIACGVEILHQQLLGPKSSYFTTSTGELFWKSGYWQHLRLKKKNASKEKELIKLSMSPSDDKTNIKELVMRFPNCR